MISRRHYLPRPSLTLSSIEKSLCPQDGSAILICGSVCRDNRQLDRAGVVGGVVVAAEATGGGDVGGNCRRRAAAGSLCYEEDSQAAVDMNMVMTADVGLVETQATAEKGSFSRSDLNGLIDLAEAGIREIFAMQRAVLQS